MEGLPVAPEMPSASIRRSNKPERSCPRSISSSQTLCPCALSSSNGLVMVLSPFLIFLCQDGTARWTSCHESQVARSPGSYTSWQTADTVEGVPYTTRNQGNDSMLNS